MGTLAGKVVLVTGAAGGIGRASALACAAQGAKLVLCDVGCDVGGAGADPKAVTSVARELEALGAEVTASSIDVTNRDAPALLVQLAVTRFGRLDGAFAAAGMVHEQVLGRLADADLERVFDVHALAAIRVARAASLRMQEQNEGGAIVLSSGQAAFVGQRGHSAYCAAAAAVTGFVRAAAVELRRHRIRINALAPIARTRATQGLPLFQSVRADSLAPEQIAPGVVYLLSALANDVSGECVGIAGNRVYTLRLHETTGAFLEDAPASAETIAAAWPEATKP